MSHCAVEELCCYSPCNYKKFFEFELRQILKLYIYLNQAGER